MDRFLAQILPKTKESILRRFLKVSLGWSLVSFTDILRLPLLLLSRFIALARCSGFTLCLLFGSRLLTTCLLISVSFTLHVLLCWLGFLGSILFLLSFVGVCLCLGLHFSIALLALVLYLIFGFLAALSFLILLGLLLHFIFCALGAFLCIGGFALALASRLALIFGTGCLHTLLRLFTWLLLLRGLLDLLHAVNRSRGA